MTPAPQPSASLTTNHLVLITRKFSPFLPSPPLIPLPPLSSCPTVRPSLCQGPANFILIGHRLGRGNDLPHCLHPSVHPVSASHLTSFLLGLPLVPFATSRLCLFFISLCFILLFASVFFPYSFLFPHMTPLRLPLLPCLLTGPLSDIAVVRALLQFLLLTLHSTRQNK